MTYAQYLFEKIGKGRRNGVSRPSHMASDRALRRLISEANKQGDIIIPLETGGYYRPDLSVPEERAEANIYLRKELHRIRELEEKAFAMEKTLVESGYGQQAEG